MKKTLQLFFGILVSMLFAAVQPALAWSFDLEDSNAVLESEAYNMRLFQNFDFVNGTYNGKAFTNDACDTIDNSGQDGPIPGMTQVGCDTINLLNSYYANNYDGPSFTVDTKAVAAALNCSEESLVATFFASEESLSSDYTANNGGCWLDADGYVSSYGQATFYLEPDENNKFGNWHTGHMPGTFDYIEEDALLQTDFVFINGDKYYNIHVNYNIKAPIHIVYTEKASEVLYKQIIPESLGYNGTEKTTLDMEYIQSVIGTSEFTLYSDVWDAETESFKWSNIYTCTPAPGFWFGSTAHNGYVTNDGWGDGAAFGFTCNNGEITWYEIPNGSAHTVGSTYSARIYFVNEETGDYLTYTINVSYVDDISVEQLAGDINQDGTVNIGDFTKEVDIILERDYDYDYDIADVNEDGWINVGDVTAISNIILEIDYSSYSYANARTAQNNSIAAELVAVENGISRYAIQLDNTTPLTGIQLDVEGARLAGQQIGCRANGQSIMANGNRVVMAGLGASAFTGTSGTLLYVDVEGTGSLKNIIASDLCGNTISFGGINLDEATGIATTAATATDATIYSANGVQTKALVNGINIIRKADGTVSKVIVK